MYECQSLMSSSDIIAVIALFIAILVPSLQWIFARRREWHDARHFLCTDIFALFDDINSLFQTANKVNHLTFQYYIKRRLTILDLYGDRFTLQKKRITKVKNIIINQLMDLPKNIEYERLLQLGTNDKGYHYKKFCEDVRTSILDATEALIK